MATRDGVELNAFAKQSVHWLQVQELLSAGQSERSYGMRPNLATCLPPMLVCEWPRYRGNNI